MKIKQTRELKDLLELNFLRFHTADFIADDPICIPRKFSKKEDIEISGFLTAIIAWGQRKTILKNANRLLEIMDHSPFDFILNHEEKDLEKAVGFVHRTFNSDDLIYFLAALQEIYKKEGGLENTMLDNGTKMKSRLSNFKSLFFQAEHLKRTEKHLADPMKGSSAKRLNMFLRWMIRSAEGGVDFGIWKSITPQELMMPLDVHTATVGRRLGLLQRKQNDWKAVEELTENLRQFDSEDPVKYDFALFGMGVNNVK
ncbi:MAG: TIGR02757 family protein [Vicingaceae bacterium]